MSRKKPLLTMSFLTLLIACGQPAPQTDATDVAGSAGAVDRNVAVAAATPQGAPVTAPSASPTGTTADLSGRWIGVEGMYLIIKPTAPDTYALDMQYDLDHKMTATGHASGDGIAFERDGKTLVLKPSDGAATGLKYLDGKTDCLTVAPGEGYCRG